jgi:hypothetical protein
MPAIRIAVSPDWDATALQGLDRHRSARTKPGVEVPALHVVRYTGEALTAGVQTHRIEGQPVRVYNVPKTIADCFKYRNKIGLEVALEALREGGRGASRWRSWIVTPPFAACSA